MARLTKEEQKRRADLLAKGLKQCCKCGRVLAVEQFSECASRKDGLQPQCKECMTQYYQENKEERLQYQQQYNQQYNKQYYQEHKQERQQYYKQYNQKHKEQRQQHQKQYYQENKEKLQQYRQENKEKKQQYDKQYRQTPQGQTVQFNGYVKRRKREETQGNGITKEQWLEMMYFFDWKCAYSGILVNTKNNRSIDHIIPLAKGGEHEVWNLVPMDKSLNSSKKDTDIMEWYTAQDFYSKERLDKIKAWQEYAYNKWSNTEEAL